jgi:hypothetical protein
MEIVIKKNGDGNEGRSFGLEMCLFLIIGGDEPGVGEQLLRLCERCVLIILHLSYPSCSNLTRLYTWSGTGQETPLFPSTVFHILCNPLLPHDIEEMHWNCHIPTVMRPLWY